MYDTATNATTNEKNPQSLHKCDKNWPVYTWPFYLLFKLESVSLNLTVNEITWTMATKEAADNAALIKLTKNFTSTIYSNKDFKLSFLCRS